MNPYQPPAAIEPDRFDRAWEEKLRRQKIEALFFIGLAGFIWFFVTLFWVAAVLCLASWAAAQRMRVRLTVGPSAGSPCGRDRRIRF